MRAEAPVPVVHHFRQIVLWPLELMPLPENAGDQTHPALLERSASWREVEDEFTGDPELFQERHYSEFVTFLPYVQRFLYGEGRGRGATAGSSPIRVFRRTDVARARLTFPGEHDPLEVDVAHVDLYFFYDIDVVILVVELWGEPTALLTAYTIARSRRLADFLEALADESLPARKKLAAFAGVWQRK